MARIVDSIPNINKESKVYIKPVDFEYLNFTVLDIVDGRYGPLVYAKVHEIKLGDFTNKNGDKSSLTPDIAASIDTAYLVLPKWIIEDITIIKNRAIEVNVELVNKGYNNRKGFWNIIANIKSIKQDTLNEEED